MQERIAMFLDYDTGVYTVEELAGRYGIQPRNVLRLEAPPREWG